MADNDKKKTQRGDENASKKFEKGFIPRRIPKKPPKKKK